MKSSFAKSAARARAASKVAAAVIYILSLDIRKIYFLHRNSIQKSIKSDDEASIF